MMMMFNISIAQMVKCALHYSTGKQHCPNHFFTVIIVQQIKSSQMLLFDERGKPEDPHY